MPWATFLLTLASGYVAVKLLGLTNTGGRLKFLGLTIAAAIFLIIQLFTFADFWIADPDFTNAVNFITEWGHVTCLAFILSSLAVFIRESKPVFAQFPMLYTGLPLLIVISYALVYDTYALKTWLIAIYQGGAIIVALLMYSVYTYRRNGYALILSGIAIFLLTYILYWYVPVVEDYSWVWKLLLGIGMVVTVLGYDQTQKLKTQSLDR